MTFSDEILIGHIVSRQAKERPDHPFLKQAETGALVTYAQTYRIINQVGHALVGLGVTVGQPVLTMLPNCLESVFAWFGCCSIGAVEAAINTAYRGSMLIHVINDSRANLIVVDHQYVDRIVTEHRSLPSLKTVVVVGAGQEQLAAVARELPLRVESWDSFLDGQPESAPVPGRPITYHDAACMLYTSGTTGPSKGVLCSYAQEYETAKAAPPGLEEADIVYSTFPPNHVGQKLYVYQTLDRGCTMVMRRAFSITHFWSDVRGYDCTFAPLLGATASFVYNLPETPADCENPLRAMMMIPIHPEVARFRERYNLKVYSFFNMTEICTVMTISDEEIAGHKSCGRVREGFDARIVDDNDEELPAGQVGELVLRPSRPWVFSLGYWGRPEQTVEAWRNLWFHTGDLFHRDEQGYFYYVDRKKDAIRRRGENVSSLEVEREINAHPLVLESAAVGVPSAYTEEEIKAVIVLRSGERLSPEQLVEFLRPRLPYFMVPRYIEFVDQLPKTATAKLLKSELRKVGVTPATWDREAAGIRIRNNA